MRARGAFKVAALLAAALFATPLCAKKDQPDFKVEKFDNYPFNLNYFEGSEVIVFHDQERGNIYRSPDGGATWAIVKDVPEGKAFQLSMHHYDHDRAYILTEGVQHYRTEDRGKTWAMFKTGTEMSQFQPEVLQFHSKIPDRIIFNGMDCMGFLCAEKTMYTDDGFRTAAKFLRDNTAGCWWAQSSLLFTTGEESKDKQRILCIVRDSFSPFKQDQRLLISDNYFQALESNGPIQEYEPDLDTERTIQGIVNLAIVKRYLLVATTSLSSDEMALFVTDDTIKWHRAMFPSDHRVEQDAYTALESTEYSIQIDVMTTRPSNPMGVMFTSNSNGTYFTRNIEHTNRDRKGHVDFEKIANIQGIFLLNKVENWEEVEKTQGAKKNVVTEITFDDGRTFEEIKTDGKRLHLHSVTELDNVGRVFSSPAPGLVMGNGNTGDKLAKYSEANLYVSDNAGLTWIKGIDGPHKYEFGDQGSILVAVKDSRDEDIEEIRYSLNHGQTWEKASLPDGLKFRPIYLTTSKDSTTLKFILVVETDDKQGKYRVIAIDFAGLHEATCKSGDMEEWFARVDDKGTPTCLMGHKQKFHRRKKDAECFIKNEHENKPAETENCDCTDQDFECDYNFVKEGDTCVPNGPIQMPEEACKSSSDTFRGSSGWRLIPGNTCKRTGGTQKDGKVDRKCPDPEGPKAPSGKIENKQSVLKGDWLEKYYLERGELSKKNDESIIARSNHEIYITHDHGKNWEEAKLPSTKITWIIPHTHFKDMVFFITEGKTVYYTVDRGENYHSFEAPMPPPDLKDNKNPLSFHPDNKNWLLWTGKKCDGDCHLETSYSKDRGDHWETAARYVDKCEFTGSDAYKYPGRSVSQILCAERAGESIDPKTPFQLVSSNDWFDKREVHERNVKDFATMAEFIVVATEDSEKKTLRALTSLDGKSFAEAQFPFNFKVPHQHAYTVLDSSTHAVNLFVVTKMEQEGKYGSIMKSNSNGTLYVLSIAGVNCGDDFYVDFEKMLGLEGVALVNVVANRESSGSKKELQTMITHNDGAQWAYLPPPDKDVDGKSFSCSSTKGDASCALHLHGYTERKDKRNTYSSRGAIGLMLGWGNVGSSLGSTKTGDTYLTRDAGITWKEVKKGRWTWAMGDQGSIIVLVQTKDQTKMTTNVLSYSTDEGATWIDHQFSEKEIAVDDITTMRSGGSRNFLIYGTLGSELVTINVDFSGLTVRQCKYDEKDYANSDYYIWSPSHPMQPDGCLFGHRSQYLRKKPENSCYNAAKMERLYSYENCTCTRQDFECDYNYELDNSDACKLVQGFQPVKPEVWCEQHPNEMEYYDSTGYRRIPLTTCEGGLQFDKASKSHPCKGHEDEYDRAHAGISGVGLFFAITIPFAAAGAIGWYAWRNWNSVGFGQIRLGESRGGAGGSLLDSDQPWVRYPVIALSAAVALIGALPLIAAGLWRTARGAAERWGFGGGSGGSWTRLGGGGTRPFTTRDSFARGRGAYDNVDDDEGELLGEDSDEDV